MNRRFSFLSTLLSVSLVASNLFETKIFTLGPLVLTGGVLIFPVSYIVNDCLSEVFGFKKTSFVIWNAMLLNLFFVCMAQLVIALPGADFWDGQEHFSYVFRADLRITAASMAAFLVGSLLNAKVMALMKRRQGEKGFGLRAVVSSLAGESIDSLIFFPIAFWNVGFGNMLVMMLIQIVLKTMYEVVLLPVTARVVRFLKSEDQG